jgi:hypothetical protein
MPGKLKKVLVGVAALAALGLGAAAFATAQNPPSGTSAQPTVAVPGAETDAKDGGKEGGDQPQPTGPAADQAKQAALQSVGSGKVTDVSTDEAEKADAGEKPDANEKPDAGEPAAPAYQSQIAWTVEVTKADGSAVDVHLDKDFKVLGTEAGGHQGD